MKAQEIILNIAVNLGRLARWVDENKLNRVSQFLEETENYLKELDKVPRAKKFDKTYLAFSTTFQKMKTSEKFDKDWAEQALTWANILSHRAKLAQTL